VTSSFGGAFVRPLVRGLVRGSASSGPPLSIVMTSLPDGTAGVAYTGQATASGGVEPYSYAKTAGPSWMTVNASTGAITGTPDASGSAITVTVTVTDAALADEPVTDTMDVAFTPFVLYAAAEKGAWYDPSDLSSMFQDSAGTVPVTADGDPIGKWNDKSGNAYKTSGGLSWVEFTTDDCLSVAAFDLTAGDALTFFAATNKTDDAAARVFLEHSIEANTNNGAFALFAPVSAAANYRLRSRGTSTSDNTVAGLAAGTAHVLTCQADISADSNSFSANRAAPTTVATNQGAGNYGNHTLFLGARNNASNRFEGKTWGIIIRAAASSAQEIANAEAYLATKSGVTLP
jgi:hypothetical protein